MTSAHDHFRPHPGAIRFSTDDVPAAQRMAYWREAICAAFVHLDLDCDRRVPFRSALAARALAHCDCIGVDGSAQRVSRSERMLDADGRDSLIVMRQRRGTCIATQDGQVMQMPADGLMWLDSRHPYALHFPDAFQQTVLKVPVRELERRIGRRPAYTGQVAAMGSGPARLAALAIDELAHEPRTNLACGLAAVTVDLLALALAREPSAASAPMSTLRVTWAKSQALQDLRDPSLGPRALAQRQGISLRMLERLFCAQGESLSGFILEQRLQRCRDALRDPAQAGRTITDIALGWGFNDPAYFARVFRRRFGAAPRDWRAGNLS